MPRRRQPRHNSTISKAWSWFIRGPWRIALLILGGIVALLTYFNEITDFINNIKENIGILLTTAIATSLLIVAIALWYLITHKNKISKKTKAFILGVSTFVLLVSVGFGWYSYDAKRSRRQKFIVAIADFYPTNQNDYGVTEDISYKLSQLLASNPVNDLEMAVELLRRPITEAEGSDEATRAGINIDADMVFWGWYTVTPTDVVVTIHIEDLSNQPEISIDTNIPSSYQVYADIQEINSFDLQKNLSDDFSSLAFFIAGNAALGNNQIDHAIEYYTRAIDKETAIDEWIYYYQRGVTYLYFADDRVKAVDDLEVAALSLLEISPDASNALNTLGVAYFSTGNFKEAKEMQLMALSLELNKENPDDQLIAYIYYNIGSNTALLEQGDCSNALEYYNKSLEYFPMGFTYLGRGLCHKKLNNKTEAIADLNQAIELLDISDDLWDETSSYRDAYYTLGGVYSQLAAEYLNLPQASEYFNEAVSNYTKAINVDPTFGNSYFSRGSLYLLFGHYEDAIRDLSQAIKINPSDQDAYFFRGNAYFSLVSSSKNASKIMEYKNSAKEDFTKVIELGGNQEYSDLAKTGLEILNLK